MKRRLISVVLFAVLAAAVSSFILFKVISGNSPSASKSSTTTILVAARDLDAGALVGDADVRPADWPASDSAHWMSKRTDVVGRALLSPLAKDEPFSESRLATKGAAAGMAARIPRGMRMVAVHVDELTGLSRFILPGMHVDVISTGATPSMAAQGMVARTILQDIEVFSTGDSERDPKQPAAAALPVFNLLVTPQQAEVLSQAVAQTRIELVLRNPLDKGSVISEVLPDLNKIITAPPRPSGKPSPAPAKPVEEKKAVVVQAPPPPPPPAPLPTIEVIHGTKRSVSTVAPPTNPEPQK
jgi:pilus assembly protein CpaB